MDRLTLRFIYAALFYFVIGIVSGLLLVFWPKWPGQIGTVHVHISLMGWLAMIVYAAGYSLVPRMTNKPLYSPGLANFQFWLSNATLAAASVFWVTVAFLEPGTLEYAFFYALLAISAVLMAISGFLFAVNIYMTMRRTSS